MYFYVVLCIFVLFYALFVLCIVLRIVCMCTELLPPGGYPIAVKYISYHIISHSECRTFTSSSSS